MHDSEKALVERFLKSYHKLLYGSHSTSLKFLSALGDAWLLEILKNSIVTYWKMRADPESEPPAFLIELSDYIEKRSTCWFSYAQERWLT